MQRVVLLRHGESVWNAENRFTGWTDVDLSDFGRLESRRAGQLIREAGLSIDVAWTSVLRRSIHTLWIVLDELDLAWIPQRHHWRLNERHYGALQGVDKAEAARVHGAEQVRLWRRSYGIRPPMLDTLDPRYPGLDPRYRALAHREVPRGESLEDTVRRVLPYWNRVILPVARSGRTVLVCAHGNTLRAIRYHLEGLSEDEVAALDIPTGRPFVYEISRVKHASRSYYLGEPAEAAVVRTMPAAALSHA
jgi:2,3-bisphosphoglycerate-dependent phosphoglycerate mutase